MDIDARSTKTLITDLQPNSTYELHITCQDSSDGQVKHQVLARTAPPILNNKPELDIRREPDNTFNIVLPKLETKDVRCVLITEIKRVRFFRQCMYFLS